MKDFKSYILESESLFNSYLNKIKDEEISFNEFENNFKKEYKGYEIDNISYGETTKSISIVYFENNPGILYISLSDDSTKENMKIKNWKYVNL